MLDKSTRYFCNLLCIALFISSVSINIYDKHYISAICYGILWAVLFVGFNWQQKNKQPELLYAGKYLRMMKFKGWDYVERTNADRIAYIIPLLIDDAGNKSLIFIKEFRIPVGKYVVGFPAGLIGDIGKEDIWAGAQRELLEETGYTGSLLPLTHGPISPGLTNETLDYFLATNLVKKSDTLGDGTENIETFIVPVYQAYRWLEEQRCEPNYMVDSKVYLGLYFVCKALGEVI